MLSALPMVLPWVSHRLAYAGSRKAENKGRKTGLKKEKKNAKGSYDFEKKFF